MVRCDFCWRQCAFREEGELGTCGVRRLIGGELVTLGYGEVVASGVDPIEKKPLYHFSPGSGTFSFALFGCNYSCTFCQNYHISQIDSPYWPGRENHKKSQQVLPEDLVHLMAGSGTRIMSYTYSEPLVWQNYMIETARLVRQAGGYNCMITNGSFSPAALKRIVPLIDAFNIDVKGDEPFYRSYCNASLRPVLESVKAIAAMKDKVLEVTTLLIEGVHTEAMVAYLGEQLAEFGVKVWHLSRFFPHYKMMDHRPTSEAFLEQMLHVAKQAGIDHVYAGNSSLTQWERTVCPSCGATLIHSHSYGGEAGKECKRTIKDGRCIFCNEPIYGRFT